MPSREQPPTRPRAVPGLMLRRLVVPVIRGIPPLKWFAKGVRNLLNRAALFAVEDPLEPRPVGRDRSDEDADLVARTDELNRLAEQYFADFKDREFIRNKPFSEPQFFAKRLFDMGVLFHWLRLKPGDTVAEIGAGTCWLSHFLNRFGCRTIGIDVSPTALEIGREVFASDPATRWELEPRFEVYDGHTLPLADASCDRIVINDAFHHVPNQRHVLTEMARILRDGGIVAMCEPGRHHSSTPESRREVEETGVLENDIVVEDLAVRARNCGFSKVTVVPISLQESIEVRAEKLGQFMKGRELPFYFRKLCDALEAGNYILLYKGDYVTSTRRPDRLRAKISLRRPRVLRTRRGEPLAVEIGIENRGNTRWLAAEEASPGWTRLGVHLYRDDGELVDFDWLRADLPRNIDPEDKFRLRIELPAIDAPGRYRLVFDPVIEGLAWFEERASIPLSTDLTVTD